MRTLIRSIVRVAALTSIAAFACAPTAKSPTSTSAPAASASASTTAATLTFAPEMCGPRVAPVDRMREEIGVQIGGACERWRIVWTETPAPYCDANTPEWMSCPCWGFSFGEQGKADLITLREDVETSRLSLTSLFREEGPPGAGGAVTLPRWPVTQADHEDDDQVLDVPAVHARAAAPVMQLADYDHDGHATEFMLQVGAGPCGHQASIVVGVDARDPKPHAFGTSDNPRAPLVLERPDHWRKIALATGPIELVQIACGDHGSDQERVIEARFDETGLHARETTYACAGPTRGERIRSVIR